MCKFFHDKVKNFNLNYICTFYQNYTNLRVEISSKNTLFSLDKGIIKKLNQVQKIKIE